MAKQGAATELEIIDICKRLNAKNMLASADGNVSVRVSDGEILITPTGLNKAFITPEDMAVIDLGNRVLKGKPSGERLIHLEVYKRCPEAKAVVHAHPPTAIAWSVAFPDDEELPFESLSELILAAGRIPIAKYARPGTPAMAERITPFLPDHRVIVMARHGALAWGESLMEAYNGMERLEHSAQILARAQSLGAITKLPQAEIEALWELRRQLGKRTL
ncbi:MAG TPA: class II aldolase/adducin family protein [Bdellovibrionales bacterium]|nr:class II aldolase/adducin family protein [Bdellovibrionales bacterium]